MTPAFKRFRDRIIHAQPVETQEGGWKKYLSKIGERSEYRWGTVAKIAALIMGGAALAATPAALIAGFAVVAAGLYGFGANGQAVARTHAEEGMGVQKSKHRRKNFVKHLIRPF